jgi:hypothetical protein
VKQTDLQELLTYLDRADELWDRHRSRWRGRRVRLCKPIVAGSRVVLQVGTLGEIVDLTRERSAPFIVQFEGFPHTVVPLLEKLDILA